MSVPEVLDPERYVVKVNNVAVLVGVVFFVIAATITYGVFRPYVPSARLTPWAIASVAFVASWVLATVVFVIRQPNNAELVRVWGRIGLGIRLITNLIVIATIWLFFPYAPRDLQLLMTTFYVCHVAAQILTQPGNAALNIAPIVSVLGSVIAFNLLHGGRYAGTVAGFTAAFAVAMILLTMRLSRLINSELIEHRQSVETAMQLAITMRALETERDAKTRFIAAASHDLGQPLLAARLFFSHVMGARTAEARSRAGEGVERALGSAEQLIAQMLGHLRLEADAVQPQISPVALGPALARLAAQYTPAAAAAGLTIRVVGRSSAVCADPPLLDRALGNLLSNAVSHGRGDRILLGARCRGDTVRIWVIDNGPGIDAVDRPYLFDDYFQGATTRDTVAGGFGLGLASVRRIARLLDGSVGFDERWRGGAAFYLDLPKAS